MGFYLSSILPSISFTSHPLSPLPTPSSSLPPPVSTHYLLPSTFSPSDIQNCIYFHNNLYQAHLSLSPSDIQKPVPPFFPVSIQQTSSCFTYSKSSLLLSIFHCPNSFFFPSDIQNCPFPSSFHIPNIFLQAFFSQHLPQ